MSELSLNGLDDIDVTGRRVLVRVDHNVPLTDDGRIRDDERIVRSLETLRELISRGARIVILSHLGYPRGLYRPELSTRLLADHVRRLLKVRVQHHAEMSLDLALEAAEQVLPGDVLYLENARFWPGEEDDSAELAARWAACGDVYVNEAFSAIHRRHASVHTLAGLLPAFAGRELVRERQQLLHFHRHDVRRGIVLGGAKLDQKLRAVSSLAGDVEVMCLGGITAMAVNHVLGMPVGQTRFTKASVETVQRAWNVLCVKKMHTILPLDWIVRDASANLRVVEPRAVQSADAIIDVGPQTVRYFLQQLASVESVFWNGPLGVYEHAPGDEASLALAAGLVRQKQRGAYVAAGGGDTLALLASAGLSKQLSYCSAGGGAALEFIAQGDRLPGLVHLSRNP